MLEKLPLQVGVALRAQRAGLEKTALAQLLSQRHLPQIELASPAFDHHAPMPVRFTADGEGVSPPLRWQAVPAGVASLALLVEDADAPTPRPLVHAIAVNIGPEVGSLPEGALGNGEAPGAGGVAVGLNSILKRGWLPPDPLPGHGEHRYTFQLFALAPGVAFPGAPGRQRLLEVVAARVLAAGCLIGTYERPRRVQLRADSAVTSAGVVPAPAVPPPSAPA